MNLRQPYLWTVAALLMIVSVAIYRYSQASPQKTSAPAKVSSKAVKKFNVRSSAKQTTKEKGKKIMAASQSTVSPVGKKKEVATIGGGCFWCLEPLFEELKGVDKAVSGYAGGTVHNPTYEEVCTGSTGHAEVVQVTFDPAVISYSDILRIFFTIHDPTTLNRQGADVGTQYRSAIYYETPDQKEAAEKIKKEMKEKGVWKQPIVTEVAPLKTFYAAEE